MNAFVVAIATCQSGVIARMPHAVLRSGKVLEGLFYKEFVRSLHTLVGSAQFLHGSVIMVQINLASSIAPVQDA